MCWLTVEQEYRRQKKRWDMFADGGTGVTTGKGGMLPDGNRSTGDRKRRGTCLLTGELEKGVAGYSRWVEQEYRR